MGIWKPDLTIGMCLRGGLSALESVGWVQNPERLGDADES